jgi:pimeloyl-ACP methyl ester carboxylesterase
VGRTGLAVKRPLLIFVVSALVAAFALPASAKPKPRPSTSPTTTTTTWPPLPAFDTTLTWTECGDGFQCATLTVPVDWRRPSGERVGIALVRRPALAPDQRIGSLVVNYGGPGESGVSYLQRTWSRLPETVRTRFDVVSFDPRGTGASRPIDCVDDSFLDLSAGIAPVPSTAAQLDVLHGYSAQFASGCEQRMGTYAGQVGTRNVARDLEAIRLSLGEAALDYLGYSYGSIVGVTYAQMYARTVGRMVLDGPPDYWINARDYAYRQAQGFMRALDGFLGWCEQTHCSIAASGAPHDVFQQLLTRVDQEPLPATYTTNGVTREGRLTPGLLENAVLSMLYDRSRGWPILADALSEAVAQGQAPSLLQIADQRLGRPPDGHWDPLLEANAVITCVDRPIRKAPTAAAELADVATFQSQLPPWGGGWATASCVGMPKPAKDDRLGTVTVQGSAPVLVIGTTGDPATPYSGAEAMVGRIDGSQLLTFDSTEHTAFGRGISTCIDDAVVAYFVDGALPAPGTHCAPD